MWFLLDLPKTKNFKWLYHYLWDKCPGCELEMLKIIFQHFKPKMSDHLTTHMLVWFQTKKKGPRAYNDT